MRNYLLGIVLLISCNSIYTITHTAIYLKAIDRYFINSSQKASYVGIGDVILCPNIPVARRCKSMHMKHRITDSMQMTRCWVFNESSVHPDRYIKSKNGIISCILWKVPKTTLKVSNATHFRLKLCHVEARKRFVRIVAAHSTMIA